jgi:pyridinium-3,5-biscarboxylic acid mononucleotide synthase
MERAVDPTTLRNLLQELARGAVSIDHVADALKELPFADLGFAKVDHHRAIRQGVAEVVFGAGKEPEQIAAIASELRRKSQNVLVTRVAPDAVSKIQALAPFLKHKSIARVLVATEFPIAKLTGHVAVVAAGTSDGPVVEECMETLAVLGVSAETIYDVGVAGIHRLLAQREKLRAADVVIVMAGMEGALPSAVGGLVEAPVIAVPTSVGYGAAFAGLAPLLGMLTSCASGILVVNIDNGFGAAFAAARILRGRAAPVIL